MREAKGSPEVEGLKGVKRIEGGEGFKGGEGFEVGNGDGEGGYRCKTGTGRRRQRRWVDVDNPLECE